jgi:hypothetical protein
VLFTHYLCTELERAQVHGQFRVEKETYRRLDPKLLYRTVVVEEQYKWYSLHSPEQLNIFCGIIGSTSTIGIRKRKPKLGHEETTRLFDALNITSKMDLFISYGKVKACIHAKRHIIGVDNSEDALVLAQSNFNMEKQTQLQQEASVLRINFKFDYNVNVCKVVLVHDNGTILTSSVWGPRKGEEIIFNSTEEVLQLVTRKQGL